MEMRESVTQETVFDPGRLLRVTDRNRDLIQLLLNNFCVDIVRQFQLFKGCCEKGSVEDQYAALHKMKGAVGNIGGELLWGVLAGYCEQLQLLRRPLDGEAVASIERHLTELVARISAIDWDAY